MEHGKHYKMILSNNDKYATLAILAALHSENYFKKLADIDIVLLWDKLIFCRANASFSVYLELIKSYNMILDYRSNYQTLKSLQRNLM